MSEPIVFRLSEIEHRLHELPEGKTYIKPFVTVRNCESMAGGLNFLNKVSVPWKLTCDELIYCHQGTFRIFYAAYPVDWKQRAGITEVPGIDPEDM
jgi:ethanolamine utilization protein EutQ